MASGSTEGLLIEHSEQRRIMKGWQNDSFT
jgi:hypothetical protein